MQGFAPHPVPVADTKLIPVGRVSVNVTPVASPGPLFLTVRVYEPVPGFPLAKLPTWLLVKVRSASVVPPKTVRSESELFEATGSTTELAVLAVEVVSVAMAVALFPVPPALETALTVMLSGAVTPPAAMVPS